MDVNGEKLTETSNIEDYSVGLRRAVFAAAIGNAIEWFDYASYGYLATVIALVFFPPGDRTVALLATFAVFASFIYRPSNWRRNLGSLRGQTGSKTDLNLRGNYYVSCHLCHRLNTILCTDWLAGTRILLLICRLVQGFSASGEYAGGSVL
jgi:MHS family proline/betaine transporter-like MFS transporter